VNYQFQKVGPNKVSSPAGFAVEAPIGGGVFYEDASGPLEIDSEWLANPPGMILYAKHRDPLQQARLEKALRKIVDALEFLGHRVEVWRDGPI